MMCGQPRGDEAPVANAGAIDGPKEGVPVRNRQTRRTSAAVTISCFRRAQRSPTSDQSPSRLPRSRRSSVATFLSKSFESLICCRFLLFSGPARCARSTTTSRLPSAKCVTPIGRRPLIQWYATCQATYSAFVVLGLFFFSSYIEGKFTRHKHVTRELPILIVESNLRRPTLHPDLSNEKGTNFRSLVLRRTYHQRYIACKIVRS